MNFTFLKIFLGRNDVRIVVICTVTGGILQIVSKQYLKSHPELLKDAPVTKDRPRSPRGGAFIEISGISITIIKQVMLNFFAEKGLTAGVTAAGLLLVKNIPATAVSTFLREALPQNLPHLEKKKFIMVGGEKIYLNHCDPSLKYLFDILEDEKIPFEEKKEIALSVLTKYLDLKTQFGRRNFALCITFMIYILYTNHTSSFYLMMKSLIKAIREGKITKPMARLIVRKLRRRGVPIDPELVEMIAS